MKFDAIIPTKNRVSSLQILLNSIVAQDVYPVNLIIIDQSENSLSKDLALNYFPNLLKNTNLRYIHDTSVNSLVEAKKLGVTVASSDIIFFLDDDLQLKPNYFSTIISSMERDKEMMGCSGFIDNARSNKVWLFFFNLFHKGLFDDQRPNIFNSNDSDIDRVQTTKLPQGTSAWRSNVFDKIQFRPEQGFHVVEDIHFSNQVESIFPNSQYVIFGAKVSHFHDTKGRLDNLKRFERKIREFRQLWMLNRTFLNDLCFFWLISGFLLEAIYLTLREKNFKYVTALVKQA